MNAGCIVSVALFVSPLAAAETLEGTEPLRLEGDIASELVSGVDRFLLREIARSVESRGRLWRRDFRSPEAYAASVEPNRERLRRILGVRDARDSAPRIELVATTKRPAVFARGAGYAVFAVRWPAFGDVFGEGLLLEPSRPEPVADVLAIPDADQTPEMLAGLAGGVPPESQFARRLAESGCRVIVPVLVSRAERIHGIGHREFLYRSAYELGRHILGYEIEKALAAADALRAEGGRRPLGAIGWGEGGLLALYAAALDPRIDAACASGAFASFQEVWRQPIERNVFGLLAEFGAAEVASLVAPRVLIVEAARAPEAVFPPGTRGAPGALWTPPEDEVLAEAERARGLVRGLEPPARIACVVSDGGRGPQGSAPALEALLAALSPGAALASLGSEPERLAEGPDAAERHARAVREIDRHTQAVLAESPYVRREFFAKLETSSLETFEGSIEAYRELFAEEVVGRFPYDLLPPAARSRKVYDEPAYAGYEVVLDVYPDVLAYGILLVPRGIAPGERRPAVVCQHGLEGRPQDLADPRVDHPAYRRFGCRLAERGFVVFAPQNLTIFGDRFRTLQRKAYLLKKTIFSIIVPQHRQIVRWLGSQPFVDPARIGFYGLSYGGKTAMRVPPLVPEYALSVCSADFNDWVWKNASSRSPYSYVWTGEYEIFEFDLGSTFNYAEMAALIAPRPFMVERGHFDGVAPDEAVAYEFAKVRFLYAARLGIPDRLEIEWFAGPHAIHGKGTFAFLHRHLRWPERTE
ncbi:MAG: alpha/beta hydrolase family protein [Planctomycetota bacterium]